MTDEHDDDCGCPPGAHEEVMAENEFLEGERQYGAEREREACAETVFQVTGTLENELTTKHDRELVRTLGMRCMQAIRKRTSPKAER